MLASVGFKYHTVFRQAFKKTTTLRKDNADRLAAFTSLQRKRDINKIQYYRDNKGRKITLGSKRHNGARVYI